MQDATQKVIPLAKVETRFSPLSVCSRHQSQPVVIVQSVAVKWHARTPVDESRMDEKGA